jgi:integrase
MAQHVTDADVADFVDECGWKATTLTNATSILCRWERWLAGQDVAPMAANHRHLRAYLDERAELGTGKNTVHKEWQTIRALYAWAARPVEGYPEARRGPRSRPGAGILSADPMLRAAAPDQAEPRVRTAEPADVTKLLDYFTATARQRRGGGEADRARRNAAMISLMFRAGCRVGELPHIDVEHLLRDERGTIVACRIGGDDGTLTKSRKGRLVPVLPETAVLIERYLRRRGLADGPLFVGREAHTASTDGRLTAQAIRLVVSRGARRCGVAISPHDMRRGFAVDAKSRGVDNGSLMTVCGWQSERMLLRYLGEAGKSLAVDELRKAYGAEPQRRSSLRVAG